MAVTVLETMRPEETFNLGETLGSIIKKGTIIELIGDLGAGKTLLTKGLIKALGSKDEATSPTFAILQIYDGDVTIYHIDGYRLESLDEAYERGLEEAFLGDGITIVEWGDLLRPLYDGSVIEVKIEKTGENTRKISIEGVKDDLSWNRK